MSKFSKLLDVYGLKVERDCRERMDRAEDAIILFASGRKLKEIERALVTDAYIARGKVNAVHELQKILEANNEQFDD